MKIREVKTAQERRELAQRAGFSEFEIREAEMRAAGVSDTKIRETISRELIAAATADTNQYLAGLRSQQEARGKADREQALSGALQLAEGLGVQKDKRAGFAEAFVRGRQERQF